MPVTYPEARCSVCGAEGNTFTLAICTNCGRCFDCCRGDGEEPHRNRRGGSMTWHGEPNALFPRYIGVEIECGLTVYKGGPVQRVIEAWNAEAISDASINLPGGREIATAPARGAEFERQIRDTCAALARQGAKVDKSCGCHVHVDARTSDGFTPTTYNDLVRLARLTDKIESGLFNLVAPSRRQNRRYCAAWGATFNRAGVFLADTLPDKERTLDCAIYGSVEAARAGKGVQKHHARYRSVNLHAFHARKTVEFRLHQGTVDPDKIINWAAVCCALVHFTFTHSDDEIAALRGTPSEILDRIVPASSVRAWMQRRREHFATLRSRTGAPPRRRAAGPMPTPMPEIVAGITPEASEV